MSQENGRPEIIHKIPAGITLQLGDDEKAVKFQLPLLDTVYEFRELAKAMEGDGKSHKEFLEEVIQLLAARVAVVLTLDQADWLVDELELEYSAFKKKRRDAWRSLQPLQSSTASIPPD